MQRRRKRRGRSDERIQIDLFGGSQHASDIQVQDALFPNVHEAEVKRVGQVQPQFDQRDRRLQQRGAAQNNFQVRSCRYLDHRNELVSPLENLLDRRLVNVYNDILDMDIDVSDPSTNVFHNDSPQMLEPLKKMSVTRILQVHI